MSLLTIGKLTSSVGAEVIGVDPGRLVADDLLAHAVLDALEDNGVLVFPGLHLNPESQVTFCRRLGAVDHSSDGHHPVAGSTRSHWTRRRTRRRPICAPPSRGTSTAARRSAT